MTLSLLPSNEIGRLAALQSYELFDSAEEADYDALTTLASVICQVPIALITLIDEERQWFKSHYGTDFTENQRALSLCTHLIASGDDIMIVPDATKDTRFSDNPIVTGPTQVTFYAGVPLINEDGYALGTLCVIDQQPHYLSSEQTMALKTLAKQVVDKMELRRKVIKLETANQELLNSNVLIQKFASMAAHDIKNPLSSIMLTSQALKMRSGKWSDDNANRLIDLNITSTKNLLGLVDEMLEYSKSPSLLLSKKQEFDLKQMLLKVIGLMMVPDTITITLPEEKHFVTLSIIAFEQIMLNLLSNAIRYNDKTKGIISIGFSEDADTYRFEVADNGIGIEKQYHEKIFINHFILHSSDRYHKTGTGIGLSTVKDLVHALGGIIYVESEPGQGTTFIVLIKK